MHPTSIKVVCKQVYARFPNLRGVQPSVQRQAVPANASVDRERYLLVFKTNTSAEDGRKMLFSVRVVVDDQGSILKLTTSR